MAEVETSATAMITGAALHAFIESRREPGERLYAVVDAAQDKELAFDGALRFGWKLQWLFSKDTAQQMSGVAPYLVPITFESKYPFPESDYLDLWAERLGNNAGILLLTQSAPERMREELASAFNVVDEEGNEFFFRFYDPRVLRLFLKACTPDEAKEFFGTIGCMLLEAERPSDILSCAIANDGVSMECITLIALSEEHEAEGQQSG